MNHFEPASAQLEILDQIEKKLRANDDLRERLNKAIFSTSNTLQIHPHNLAIYILIRTHAL